MAQDLLVSIILEGRNMAGAAFAEVRGGLEGITGAAGGAHGALGGIMQGIELGAGIAAFQALSGALGEVATGAVKFQTMMTELQNNTTLLDKDMGAARDTILALSSTYGVATDTITTGYRHVIDIVQNAAASQELLNVAVEGSAASGANAAEVANVLAGVMHEYGTDVVRAADGTVDLMATHANASHTLGVMTAAAQDANSTLQDWTGSMSAAIGIAASGGQPLENLGAIFGSLTLHGFPDSANAGLQVKDMLVQLAHLTPAATKELERLGQATGIDVVGDLKKMNEGSMTLVDFLGQLREAFQKAGLTEAQFREESERLIAGQRGGLGLNALLTTGYTDMLRIQSDLSDQTRVNTVVDDTWNRTRETAGKQWDILKEQVSNFGITLGSELLPAITPVIRAMSDNLPAALATVGDAFNGLKTGAGDALQGVADSLARTGADWAPWAAQAGTAGVVVDKSLAGTSEVVQALQFLLQGNYKAAWQDAQAAMGDFGDAANAVFKIIDDHKALIESVGVVAGTWMVFSTIAPAIMATATAYEALAGAIALVSTAASGGGFLAGVGALTALAGGPVTLAIVGVAVAVAALGVAWVNNWGDIQGKTEASTSAIKASLDEFDTDLHHQVNAVGEFRDGVNAAFDPINANIDGAAKRWGATINAGWEQDKVDASTRLTAFRDAINAAMDPINATITTAVNSWTATLRTGWDQDVLDATTNLDKLGRAVDDGLKPITSRIGQWQVELHNAIGGAFSSVGSAASNFGSTPGGGYDPSSMQMGQGAGAGSSAGAGTGGGGAIPAAGDKAGWAHWLQNSGAIPSDLANDPTFLNILLTGGQAESGLSGNRTQPTYTDAQGRRAGGAAGLFQFDPGGMGAGMSPDFLNSPAGTLYEAQQIIPKYAAAYRSQAAQSQSGAAQAAYVADQAEAPAGAWPGGAGDNNYRAAYGTVMGAAPGGGYDPSSSAMGPAGVFPQAQAAVAPVLSDKDQGDIAAGRAFLDAGGKAAKIPEVAALDKSVDTGSDWLVTRQAALDKTNAGYDRAADKATSKVGTDLADKLGDDLTGKTGGDLFAKKQVDEDIKARKDALAERQADAVVQNNIDLAHQALLTKRADEDALTRATRAREDSNITTNIRLAHEALVHTRGLQDTEIQYQHGLQLEATAHSQKLENAKIIADHILQDAATAHQRTLQDQQIVVSEQLKDDATAHQQQLAHEQTLLTAKLANAQLLHQRALQDAQIQPTEDLSTAATSHSRGLQDQDTVYAAQQTQIRSAAALQVSLAAATTDVQKQQINATYQANITAIALAAKYAAEDLAHKRQMEDQEAEYQEGLAAKALAKSRALQDAEITYQAGIADQNVVAANARAKTESDYQEGLAKTALDLSRKNADTETAYQRGLQATALELSRANALVEQNYKDGLAQTALEHSRTLQDTEIAYQIGVAHTALMAKRVDEDALRADTRAKEDADIAAKIVRDKTAADFAKAQKKEQADLDKKLADEAYDRQVLQLKAEADIARKNIADNLIAQKTAAIEQYQADVDAHQKAFDKDAADTIAKAKKAVEDAGGNFAPIEAVMTAAVNSMDAAFAGAHDTSSAALVDLGNQTVAALGTGGRVPKAVSDTAAALVTGLGQGSPAAAAVEVSDKAVEMFGQQFGLTWEVARPLLGDIERGIYTHMGENQLIPNHIKNSNDKVIEFAKQWGISWPEAAAVLSTGIDKDIKATFGVGGVVDTALANSTTKAYALDVAIQSIKDKQVTITVDTVNNTAGGNIASGGALGGMGSSSSNNQGGSSGGGSSAPAASSSGGDQFSTYAGRQAYRDSHPGSIVDASGAYTPPGHAEGGTVEAGKIYTIGEKGPETFVAGSSGYVFPNGTPPGGNSGTGDVHVHLTVNGSMLAGSPAQLAEMIRTELIKIGARSGSIFGGRA